MATLAQLERALVNADRAGDLDAARKLAAAIVREREKVAADPASQILGGGAPQAPAEKPGMLDRIKQVGSEAANFALQVAGGIANPVQGTPLMKGAAEAGLTLVTGATGGAAGMLEGAIPAAVRAVRDGTYGTQQGVQDIARAAEQGAAKYTYEPRTEVGRQGVQALGQAMEALVPVAPLAAELQAAARAVQAAQPAAQATARAGAASAQELAAAARAAAAEKLRPATEVNQPTMGGGRRMGSVGAAGVDEATIRQQAAQELPVPVELTKGQATRDFEQLRFEQEMAKDPTKGAPIRDRMADQRQQLWRNFDTWLDETGARAMDLPGVGDAVKGQLRASAAADKNRTRAAYVRAEKAGEMEAPVTLGNAVSWLNENTPDAVVTPLIDAMKARALRLGIATADEAGNLIPQPVTLKTAELWRRSINNAMDAEPTNIRAGSQVKGLIDEATEGLGGDLYRQARQLRREYADKYESFGLARDLLNAKRGTNDARIAAEEVFRRSVLTSSMADLRQLGRLLKSGGEEGQQAMAELRGAAIRHIRDEASKNITRDERGTPVPNLRGMQGAITQLDRAGKLDYLFGKKGAEQLRAINDLANVMFNAPPGVVNTSNTASVILAALDMATSGVAGMPLPVMSGLRILTTHVRDRQIQKRINDALGIKPAPKKVKRPEPVIPAGPNTTRMPENRTIQ